MNWLQAIWNFLNGNKTVIGMALLWLAQYIPADTMLFGFIPVKALCEWIGGLLTGVGVVHKFAKSNTDPGPNV